MFSNVLPEINEWLGTNINFLLFGDNKTVLGGLLIANNWQWVGYWMLIYLAGLQSVQEICTRRQRWTARTRCSASSM